MNINHEIEEKARQIMREKQYVLLCVDARICPLCGSEIKLDTKINALGHTVSAKFVCTSDTCRWMYSGCQR